MPPWCTSRPGGGVFDYPVARVVKVILQFPRCATAVSLAGMFRTTFGPTSATSRRTKSTAVNRPQQRRLRLQNTLKSSRTREVRDSRCACLDHEWKCQENQAHKTGACWLFSAPIWFGIVSFSVFMGRSDPVPAVVFPSKNQVHQNTKSEAQQWIRGQHNDAKDQTRMAWKIMIANPMSYGPHQCTRCDKTEQFEKAHPIAFVNS